MDQGRAQAAARPPPPKPPRPPRPPRPTALRTLRKSESVCAPSTSSPTRPVQQLRKQSSVSCNQPQDGRRFTVQCGDVSYVIDVDSARHDSPVTFYQPRSGRKSINLADTPVITLSPRPTLCATAVPSATSARLTKPSTSFADDQRQQRNASKSRNEDAAPEAADAESKKQLAAVTCIERLRYILHQLNRGELPLEDLKRNIEYAALVLETAYMDETRRICDEDDDLAEVTPETVPDEVREWLAATFTRQTATTSRQKPKFKSVANAIRTGIFFDKMFRKTQMAQAPIPPDIAAFLKNVNTWSFSSFELNHVSDGHALKYVGFELFNRYGFLDRFKIHYQTLESYMLALETGYSKHNNPYHNLVHAADVAQTSHFMLSQTGLANSLGDLELFAVLFGALIHDYEHTGHTNSFHIQSGSNFALLYNDRSVLENHHVSSCFRLMKDTDKNILEHLTREEFREFRNMVIEIVLATDMSTHFVQIKTMKNMLSLPEGIDKNKALCLIVHACDISHPAKPWKLHEQWTQGVLEEFFRQGDLEASMGLPYSPLCDRHTTHVAESQIGFIDFIVEPTMVVCSELLTKMVEPLVSIPPHESLSLSTNGTGDNDGGSGSNSAALSPLPDLRGSSPSSVRRLPLTHSGKLEIPNPWTKMLLDNKAKWKERAAKEEAERKAKEAAAAKNE